MNIYCYKYLTAAMKTREQITISTFIGGQPIKLRGLVNGIRPEDGSGRNWLIVINNTETGMSTEVFVKTS